LDYFIIGSARDIASSFLGNLAFLPIYVIFVTLMVEQIMRERERQTFLLQFMPEFVSGGFVTI
jgi:hypothetical protein